MRCRIEHKIFKYRKGQKTSPRDKANRFANKLVEKGVDTHPLVYRKPRRWDKKRGWPNYDTWVVEYQVCKED